MNALKVLISLFILSILTATSSTAQIPERRLDKARKLVEQTKHNEAIEEYLQIKKWLKRDPGLLIEMARVYTYANRHSEAIKLFESIRKEHPKRAQEFEKELADQYAYLALRNARGLVEKKEYEAALKQYDKIGALEKRDAGLVVEHARVYSYASKHKESMALYEEALKQQPGQSDKISKELQDQKSFLILGKARELVKQKKYEDAIKEYDSISEWLKRDPGLILEHARVYAYASKHEESVQLLESSAKAAKQDSQTAGTLKVENIEQEIQDQKDFIRLDVARTLVEANRYDEALEIYEELSDLLEKDAGLLLEHARVHTYANSHDEAILLFEKAITKSPELAKTAGKELQDQKMFIELEKARTLVEREQYDAAIEVYETLDNLLVRDPGLVIEKARVYSYAKRHDEAAKVFETVLKTHKEYTPVFMRELGDMYTWQHYYDKAISIYRSSLKLNPEDLDARLSLARALAWKGDVKEAHEIYDNILGKTPEYIAALLGKADAYTMQDKLGAANDLLDKLQELEPGNIDAINMRARIMVWQGYHNQGVDLYRELLALYPENLEALEGLAFGLHWGDRAPEAFDVLEKLLALRPSRTEANKLMTRLRNARRPYISLYGDYRDSSKPRETVEYGISAGSVINKYLNFDFRYGIKNIKEEERDDENMDAQILGLFVEYHILRRLILDLDFEATDYNQAEWQELFVDTDLMWRPLDVLYLDVGYERDAVNSIGPIYNELIEDSLSARIKWKPDRMWMFSAKQSFGEYSDSNANDTTLFIGEFRAKQTPYLKLYYNYYRGQWDQEGEGYFSPEDFYAHTIGAYLSRRFSAKRFGYIQGSLGREHHGDGIDVPNYYLAAGYVYRPNSNWKMKISASYFDSESEEEKGHEGYRETHVWLSIARSFGGHAGKDEVPTVAPTPVPESR